MISMSGRYTIILEEDVEVDPRKYGEAVGHALGLTKIEARIAVRKGRGIFVEQIGEEHARKISQWLKDDEIPHRLISEEEMPTIPPFRKATHLTYGDDFLSCKVVGSEKPEHVLWDAIGAVSIGAVAKPEYTELFGHVRFDMVPPMHEMEGDEKDLVREKLLLNMAIGKDEAERRKPEAIFDDIDERYANKVRVYADVFTADLGTWLRIPMDSIGYLRVAGKVRMGGAMGMQLLATDLQNKCSETLSPMTLKLLDAHDIKALVFPQIEEFNRYSAWHLYR